MHAVTTLLIIDNHESIRQALAQRLNRVPGIQVVGTAGDGAAGLAQARAACPDVVLLEPKLPDGQGLDVLRAIRAEQPGARVIVLTSYLDDFERRVALKAGAERYLLKDIDSEKLADVILCRRSFAMKLPRLTDIMSREPAIVGPNDTLRVAIDRMRTRNCRRLPVVDGDRLVGIVSDRDVRLALNSPFIMRERREDEALLDRVLVAECMTPNPVCLTADTPVVEAARLMRDRKFGGLPVVEGERLIGIVTETDLLDCFIKLCSE